MLSLKDWPLTWPDRRAKLIGNESAGYGRLAQLVERLPYKQVVGGSSPPTPIFSPWGQCGRLTF